MILGHFISFWGLSLGLCLLFFPRLLFGQGFYWSLWVGIHQWPGEKNAALGFIDCLGFIGLLVVFFSLLVVFGRKRRRNM